MQETYIVKHIPNKQQLRPYEKFINYGPDSMSDEELLALILRTGTTGKDAVSVAKDVLEADECHRGLLGIHHLSLEDLTNIQGIGTVKAVKLKCIAELSIRMSMQRQILGDALCGPAQIAMYYMESMRHLEYEQCLVLFMDSKCHILQEKLLSIGTISSTVISKRELMKAAFKVNAAQIILLHNHPSGDPTPSCDDKIFTEQINYICTMFEIPLVDHIIIGDNTYISFKEKGFLT